MTSAKKPVKSTKATKPDVNRPGKSAPSSTSKPVIVTNRPILKDPMVTEDGETKQETGGENLAHTTGPKLKPLEETAETSTKESKPDPVEQPKAQPKTADKDPSAETEPADKEDTQSPESTETKPETKDHDQEAVKQARHEAVIQELVDSKKCELPINAVEKRKARHFVVLGIVLAIFLVLAWANIALDAGLIQIDGIKPVTHFFSN